MEKKDIIEILDKYGYESDIGECVIKSTYDIIADEILAASPWKKFEGKVDCYPYLLRNKKHPKNVMLYIENEDSLRRSISKDGLLDEDFYYMHISPL